MEPLPENHEIKISDLPQIPSWKRSVNLYKYQQFWYYESFVKGIILFQKNFISQPNDIFLCSPPKSGTTWLKALCISIQTRTRHPSGDSSLGSPLLSKNPHDIVTCTEILYGLGKDRDPQIPLVHTHVPFSSLPESIQNSNGKIIYICRDPKDVFVSQFFFVSKNGIAETIPLEEAYEKFCDGVAHSGPYWDHVLGYWKVSLEFPERVLFLKYEELKKNTCFYVEKIADFMGCGFSADELKVGVAENIVKICSFENLSSLEVNKSTSKRYQGFNLNFGNKAYFRKGEIEDWKNYLSGEMAERIDKITHQKFNGYGLHM